MRCKHAQGAYRARVPSSCIQIKTLESCFSLWGESGFVPKMKSDRPQRNSDAGLELCGSSCGTRCYSRAGDCHLGGGFLQLRQEQRSNDSDCRRCCRYADWGRRAAHVDGTRGRDHVHALRGGFHYNEEEAPLSVSGWFMSGDRSGGGVGGSWWWR